jgi:VIT1/CCC1 family predicted Fe2+/Mn2+ transporter
MTFAATHGRAGEIHHDHRDVAGGWLRPAVFGAMDGVLTNVALITSVAAAGQARHVVVLTGVAGLLAGAMSMAVGEWTSVRSQVQLVAAEIAVERPEAEEAELAGIFRSRGLPRELAATVARELSKDPEVAWRVHVREELGVDPDDLPEPLLAAGSSLGSFAVGAFVPLAPYIFGASVLWLALVLAGVALLAIGAGVARFTGRPPWRGALLQLALGVATAAITYGVGRAFGASVS